MERRVFIAVLLSFAVLYGYQALFVPTAPKTSPSTTTSTTAPPSESSPSASAPSATQAEAAPDAAEGPSVEALVSESAAERAMQPLERVWRAGEDPGAAIGRAARELNRVLVADEVGLHVMERSFMAVWLDGAGGEHAPRPGRRLRYIRPIVDALKEELPPAARRRLVQALTMVMGTEAVLALRDVAGASVDEALEASAWAAQALLRQARAEASQAKARRGAARAAPRRERPAAVPPRRRGIT